MEGITSGIRDENNPKKVKIQVPKEEATPVVTSKTKLQEKYGFASKTSTIAKANEKTRESKCITCRKGKWIWSEFEKLLLHNGKVLII